MYKSKNNCKNYIQIDYKQKIKKNIQKRLDKLGATLYNKDNKNKERKGKVIPQWTQERKEKSK